MAHSFRFLRERMSPEAQQTAEQKTQTMLMELPFQELRDQLVARLQVEPASILKIKRRTGTPRITLRKPVKAMNSELKVATKPLYRRAQSKPLQHRYITLKRSQK